MDQTGLETKVSHPPKPGNVEIARKITPEQFTLMWKHISNRSWEHQPWIKSQSAKKNCCVSDRHLVSTVIRFAEVFTCHEIGSLRNGDFYFFLEDFFFGPRMRNPSWERKTNNRRRVSRFFMYVYGYTCWTMYMGFLVYTYWFIDGRVLGGYTVLY